MPLSIVAETQYFTLGLILAASSSEVRAAHYPWGSALGVLEFMDVRNEAGAFSITHTSKS